jgi:hypothetical protein
VLNRGRLLAVGAARALEREFSDERYRIRTRDPEHRGWRALEVEGVIGRRSVGEMEADGWTPVECHVPGGRDAAAHVLASLVGAGVGVAGFDRVELSLADLIERIVASRELATAGA